MNEDLKTQILGQQKQLTLPSGYTATIREQNGNDDDVLSNKETAHDLTNFNTFIAGIITDTNLPGNVGGKLGVEAVGRMLLRDKYFILFSSRIHSCGETLRFIYDWGPDLGGEIQYAEDLKNYVPDYTTDLPEEGDADYFKYRIEPYNLPEPYVKQEILIDNKKLRFKLLDGLAEKYLIKISGTSEDTINSNLRARELEEFIDNKWVKVENFTFFTKKQMNALRNTISHIDKEFKGFTELECPKNKQIINFPILSVSDFFYPEEI